MSLKISVMKRKKISSRLNTPKAIKWFWIVLCAPFVLLFTLLALVSVGAFGKLPSFEELENPKSNIATEVYSEDGKVIGSFFLQNRSVVDYDELNSALIAALVGTEDMRFYNHSGIDFISLARVGIKSVALGDMKQGGGSTITQQLAKNLFPRDTVSNRSKVGKYSRLIISKLKEWVTAVKLEYNYTKEEILAMYFNTVEYGSNAFGIKSAAQIFFNKAPQDLTINEAAMLVGVVNAPTRYSPIRNPNNALKRRNTVISRMEVIGYITKNQRDSLVQVPIELDYAPISHIQGTGTYFREMLRGVMTAKKPTRKQYRNKWDYEQALTRWEDNPIYGWCGKNVKSDGTPYNIYKDGLKIYTTINSRMQKHAEDAVQQQLETSIQPAMDRQYKRTKVTFLKTKKSAVEQIIKRTMRYMDQYIQLKKDGASDKEIEKVFNTKVKMRVFTYKGEVDTVISPRESILHHKRILRASLMAIDPTTGEVKAYVGGPSYKYFKYDMVKQGKRQAGSTFKPFVYTFAIDHLGYTPCTMVANLATTIPTDTGDAWQPKEAGSRDDIYDGEMKPLRWGLANSRNNYSAWIMKQAKQPAAVADFVYRLGITSYIDPVNALCLGTPDVSLFEMVSAYSTYANRGVYTEPIFVTRIEDRFGNIIQSFTPTSEDAISEESAYTMLGMLQNVVNAGTARRLRWSYNIEGEIGGKTGTSQENRDAWFIGVVPKLVAGIWVGGEDQSVHLTSRGEGSALALPIYGEFMKRVFADKKLDIRMTDIFPRPSGGAVIYDCDQEIEQSQDSNYNESKEDEFFD